MVAQFPLQKNGIFLANDMFWRAFYLLEPLRGGSTTADKKTPTGSFLAFCPLQLISVST